MLDHTRKQQLNEALELLYFGYRAFTRHPDELLAQHGLTRVHHRVLYFVGRHPGLNVGRLLAILDVSKQALNRPLRELTEGGWISATLDPRNRRVKRLCLTERGAALEEQLSTDQRTRFARAFAAAGPDGEEGWRTVMKVMGE
jgi:DNA-binding MarR family transcriptional regulator